MADQLLENERYTNAKEESKCKCERSDEKIKKLCDICKKMAIIDKHTNKLENDGECFDPGSKNNENADSSSKTNVVSNVDSSQNSEEICGSISSDSSNNNPVKEGCSEIDRSTSDIQLEATVSNSELATTIFETKSFVRQGFKPKGRMLKKQVKQSEAAPQFIMDVPDAWGMGVDGTMMEMFNKVDIKDK